MRIFEHSYIFQSVLTSAWMSLNVCFGFTSGKVYMFYDYSTLNIFRQIRTSPIHIITCTCPLKTLWHHEPGHRQSRFWLSSSRLIKWQHLIKNPRIILIHVMMYLLSDDIHVFMSLRKNPFLEYCFFWDVAVFTLSRRHNIGILQLTIWFTEAQCGYQMIAYQS